MKKNFNGGRALLIGIGQGYPGTLQLSAVVRADAEGLGRVLCDPDLCGYPSQNVQLLLDGAATRQAILDGLRSLQESATPEDTVVVFFSGHGGHRQDGELSKTYICPVDYDRNAPETTGIEADELSAFIKAIPASRVVVILDSCHADGAVHLKSDADHLKIPFGFRAPALEKLASGSGRVVISSCRESETSITFSAKGHSLFTYFLLEGLRGGAPVGAKDDGLVRVFELFEYVSTQVPANPVVRNHVQHPVMKMHAEDNFPIALRRGGWFKSTEAQPPATAPGPRSGDSVDARMLEQLFVELYPEGPVQGELWSRAGGDDAALKKSSTGRAAWHATIKLLLLGGGGANITKESLVETALQDYPNNPKLRGLA